MTNGTFTFGTTPEKVILTALSKDGNYPMKLVGEDAEALISVVNEGIDSHLTAVTNSTFNWKGNRLVCDVESNDMLVILRRLFDNGSEAAWSFRSGILTTLEIEEI